MEVEAAMCAWLNDGNSVLFLTLTAPHDLGQDCAELLDTIGCAYTHIFSGRPYRRDRDRFRIEHWFRSWDATHGRNGWHPHLHAALFVRGQLDDDEIRTLERSIDKRWRDAVRQRGLRPPSEEHGVRLEGARGGGELAGYLLKVSGTSSGAPLALELTRGDLKRGPGRTPFQILADFASTGDFADLALFHEWEAATKGRHFSQWSRGAKKALGVVDRSDEELIEKEVGGVVLHRFTAEEWIALTRTPGASAQALRVAEAQGQLGVRAYLAAVRARWRHRRFQRVANAA